MHDVTVGDASASPRNTPLANSLAAFCRAPQQFLLDRARAAGPVTLYRLNDELFASVSDPEIVHAVLHGSMDDFEKGPLYDILRKTFGDGIFTAERDHWSNQHAIVAPLFARHRIRRLGATIHSLTSQQIERWRATGGDAEVDVLLATKRLAFDLVAIGLFTMEDVARRDTLFEAMHRLDRLPMVTIAYLGKSLPVERLGGILARGDTTTMAAVTRVDELLYAIADERLALAEQPDDAIGAAVASAFVVALPPDRKRAVIRDLIGSLLTAGYVSTGEALFWTLYLLARHPDVQARARAEVDAAGTPVGEPPLDAPPYLAAVFNESLRLYPPAWYLGRTARRPLQLGGVDIPTATQIVCSPFVLQRMPALWPDPDAFVPDRFLPGAPIVPRSFIPFGSGMRACVGRALALMEMSAFVAAAITAFDLQLTTDAPATLAGTYSMYPRERVLFRLRPRP